MWLLNLLVLLLGVMKTDSIKKNSPNEAVLIFSFLIALQAFLNELQLNHL